jgi:hypothetical protein
MFTVRSSGLRSFRDMATDLESTYYKCPIFKPSFKRAFVAKTSMSRGNKYVTPLSLDTWDWAKAKALTV